MSSDDGDLGDLAADFLAADAGDLDFVFARDGDSAGFVAAGDFLAEDVLAGDFLAAGVFLGAAAAAAVDARRVERPVVMATTFSEVSTGPESVLLRFVVAGFSAATGAADAALLRRLDVLVAVLPLVWSEGVDAVFATACRHEGWVRLDFEREVTCCGDWTRGAISLHGWKIWDAPSPRMTSPQSRWSCAGTASVRGSPS